MNHLLLIFIDNSPVSHLYKAAQFSLCIFTPDFAKRIRITFSSFQPEEATEPTSVSVPFLQKYSDIRNKKPTVSISSN